MKVVIFVNLIFMCCVGVGQTYTDSIRAVVQGDSVINYLYQKGKIVDSTSYYIIDVGGGLVDMKLWNNTNFIDSILPKRDTVKVILQVSDTSRGYQVFASLYNNTLSYDTSYFDPDYKVYWYKGYVVREKHNTIEGVFDPYFCGNCVYSDYWKDLYYLDFNMLPLKKSIIIWQVKYLK